MPSLIRRDSNESNRGRGQDLAVDPTRAWDPFRLMDSLLRWEPYAVPTWFGRRPESFVPQFDVKETKDGYLFRADMPGVKEADLELSVTGNVLSISGRREEERKEEGEQYYTLERSYGSFTRSFALPDGVDYDSVKADLKDGVLTVHIAKKPEVQPRKIAIGTGAASKA